MPVLQWEWFYKKLDEQFTGLKQKYIKQFGNSYECHSPKTKELSQLFRMECDKCGILYRTDDIVYQSKKGYVIFSFHLTV